MSRAIRHVDSDKKTITVEFSNGQMFGAGGPPFVPQYPKTTEGAPSFAVSKGWEARHPIPSQLFLSVLIHTSVCNMQSSHI